MKQSVKVLPLAMALAFAAGSVHAVGLGSLEVKSQLNQPLVAEIPLIGVAPGELDQLSVRLAPPEAFERVGLPRPAGVTANLQFSVGRNARGEPVVRVTTSGRVDDPFVAFLLEADWGKGSVVREFTALVDPPHIAAATVLPMAAPTVSAAPRPTPAAPTAAPPVDVAPVAEPEPLAAEPLPTEAPVAVVPPAESMAAEPTVAETAPEPVASALAPPSPSPASAVPEPAPAPVPVPVPTPAPAPVAPPPPALPPAPAPAVVAGAASREVFEGDNLWAIAEQNRRGSTMAQMMLAIQRANPDAFIRENINLLRKGAVLRIPTDDEAQALVRREAEAEVRVQMQAWRAMQPARAPAPGEAPAVALPPAATAQAPGRSTAAGAAAAASGRLEIAPPAGAGAAGAQSGAASGGAGSELRAELEQVREDLSARDAELQELRARLSEQESLANEQQRLIELKDSQLSAMEQALREQREAQGVGAETDATAAVEAPAAPPAGAESAPVDAPAADDASPQAPEAAGAPWFRDPLVLGGGGLLLVGGLVALLLRRRAKPESKRAVPKAAASTGGRSRLSDDADFLAKLPSKGGESASGEADDPAAEAVDDRPAEGVEKAASTREEASSGSEERPASPAARELEESVAAKPADLDAHVALLRHHYNSGDVDAFLAAAETMRAHVAKQGDPRWREAVVMGMGLVPGHALFRELQWNPISSADVHTRSAAHSHQAAKPGPIEPEPTPEEPAPFSERETAERPAADGPGMEASGMDDTRLELAKAYIEIGDADGARGMLEEVLAEGSPEARAEAERLLKSIG